MSFFRNIRTTAEHRAIPAAAEQGVAVRSRRCGDNLPNAYDDIKHSRRGRPDRHKNHRRK